MVSSVLPKPFGLVLIITAHMVITGQGHEQVTGILGHNITLQFTFNVTITKRSKFGVYITENEQKISDISTCKSCFDTRPKISSVFYHMTNLTLNDSKVYHASFIFNHQVIKSNNTVKLVVEQEIRSTAAPQTSTASTIPPNSRRSNSFPFVIVLVPLPLLLLAAVIIIWISCLKKGKHKEQQGHKQTPNSTLQQPTDSYSHLSAPSVIYSVLNFPKRPPAAVEVDPCCMEYDVVSYPPQQQHM